MTTNFSDVLDRLRAIASSDNKTISYDDLDAQQSDAYHALQSGMYFTYLDKDGSGFNECVGLFINPKQYIPFGRTGINFGGVRDFDVENKRITGVYKPNEEYAYPIDIYKMEIVWEPQSKVVEMSVSDIEKKLGLEPGTLVIK